jgi:2-isopropylmalate synthase
VETRIQIFDTTLRDGEQAAGCSMTIPEKLKMARMLDELGVDVMEAGFPIASEGDFESVRRIALQTERACVAGLARAKQLDIERAARAVEGARRPRIHTFIATSPIHREHKLRMSKAQILDEAVKAVRMAKAFVEDVEFSAEDGSRTEVDFLCEVARAVALAGARTINIPDTVGYTMPREFERIIEAVVKNLEGTGAIVSVHCHNDLGLATANSLAGIAAGARQVECTLNGIGERAGNAAMEEVVMALRTRRDIWPCATGIQTPLLYPTSQALSEIIAFEPQPNKAVVGRNAFAHESGIHQDGILKERTTYEIMDPSDVGVPESRLVLGKHSGRHAIQKRLEYLGHPLDRTALEAVYHRFSALADDRKKGVSDEEIVAIAQEVKGSLAAV